MVWICDHYECSNSGVNSFGIEYVYHWIYLINTIPLVFQNTRYMITYMYILRCEMNFTHITIFIQIYHYKEVRNLLKRFGCILFEIYRCIESFRCGVRTLVKKSA